MHLKKVHSETKDSISSRQTWISYTLATFPVLDQSLLSEHSLFSSTNGTSRSAFFLELNHSARSIVPDSITGPIMLILMVSLQILCLKTLF